MRRKFLELENCGECKKSCRICKRHWGNCFKYEYRKNSQKIRDVEF